MLYANALVTGPVSEPVSLTELKAHARIEDSSGDSLLSSLIVAARQWTEAYTRRALLSQTWALFISKKPIEPQIALPRAPLSSVTKFQVLDENGIATDWDATHYYVDSAPTQGVLVLRQGCDWPEPLRKENGLRIEYVAGYGSEPDDVPQDIRLAIMQLALHWYENRGEAVASAAFARPPLTIEALLAPHRLLHLGATCS